MARRQACLGAALACLVALQLAAAAGQDAPVRGLEALLPAIQTYTSVSTARELLDALNQTAGSSVGQLITLQDDILIRPEDLRAFGGSLPINGGNRTLVLHGGERGGNKTVLDWGAAVNVMYHPVGHAFFTYNVVLRDMATASDGFAAGLTSQMVGGAFWPSTTGEPDHTMGLWNTVIELVNPNCGFNSTQFTVQSLQQVVGRNDTITMLDNQTFFVGQQLSGSYAVRVIPTGGPGGNVRWSWDNTTVHCSKPVPGGAPGDAAAAVASQTDATGIAATADELLYLLSSPSITRIVVGAHISLSAANWQAHQLPIVFQQRNVTVESNDDSLKVLDLGASPRLLYLSATSSLGFSRVQLQGVASPSSVINNRTTMIVGSPLWPTVDGEAGHQLIFVDCTVRAVITPCSRNATQITIQLLRKVLDEGAVQSVGDTGYVILPRFVQNEPIRSVVTREQVGSTPYTFQNTIMECEEDSQVGLASELQALRDSNAAMSGGMPSWLLAVIAVLATALVGAAAGTAFWLLRRRRAAARLAPDGGAKLLPPPESPQAAKLDKMESGEFAGGELQIEAVGVPRFSGPFSADAGAAKSPKDDPVTPERQLAETASRPHDALWRARFGVIEGLEIGEMLGRGGYGRVYKGRWNGAVVAVKVVEHRIASGEGASLSREALLCMNVSHPNCITTYKLSVIRLLRGEDLSEEQGSEDSIPRISVDSLTSGDDTAMTLTGSDGSAPIKGRRVRSLLSGAEAVEVADTQSSLQPGMYESWIVSEYCDRRTLGDALAEKTLRLPDGRTNMVSVYMCLLDVASGMQYLHSLGIMHSDLKPANVLLKGARNNIRGFTCKLADFGLSRMLDGRDTHVQTGSYGTPTHAAPELLREGRLSTAADVFAFGILAWELVAGEEAYRGMHPMQIIMQVTQNGARPPPLPHCPPALAALMERCWQEDPAARPFFPDLLLELQEQLQAYRRVQQPGSAISSPPSGLSARGSSSTLLPPSEQPSTGAPTGEL